MIVILIAVIISVKEVVIHSAGELYIAIVPPLLMRLALEARRCVKCFEKFIKGVSGAIMRSCLGSDRVRK